MFVLPPQGYRSRLNRDVGFTEDVIFTFKIVYSGTTCKPRGDGSHSTPEESSSLRNEKEKPVFKRRKGESLKDFLERIDVEGRARMVESCKANRKITERRKK